MLHQENLRTSLWWVVCVKDAVEYADIIFVAAPTPHDPFMMADNPHIIFQ